MADARGYAEVLLPLPLAGGFTYAVPEGMEADVQPGRRVVVPFGSRRFYTGIVTNLVPRAPEEVQVKEIMQVLDPGPIVRHPQLKFWEWIADYYLCSAGEVYRAAMPSGLKLESETYVEWAVEATPEAEADAAPALASLGNRERIVATALRSATGRVKVDDLVRDTGLATAGAVVSQLVDKRLVRVSEKLVERYHAKTVHFVTPALERNDGPGLKGAFAALRGAPRQEKAFLTLLELSGFMRRGPLADVTRAELMEKAGVTAAIVGALAARGLVTVEKRVVSRFTPDAAPGGAPLPTLSPAQQTALDAVLESYRGGRSVTLLRGVTASGKTELYIHLIDRVLREGSQVLYLVPEIALTTQLTRRLQRVFGRRVVVYHSKHSDAERVETWRSMLTGHEPRVVVGARSSVFLPFARLGLVIVDEEHEASFKQQDPAPRYNARDAALVLASMHGAKALLGSATPAIDTYYKARSGRYGLVELTERYDSAPLPDVEMVDMALARQQRAMAGAYSYRLRRIIGDTLDAGRQAIVFLNRRGYAPMAVCRQCGHVPKCRNCDVSLTYHKSTNELICHYCGARQALPRTCPGCDEPGLEVTGYGTERVEDDLELYFPKARILRMDLDTTRNKDGYERIITDFSARKADLLVGTQMVTKGLDFDNVGLVAVVNADALVHQPDFRSAERAFNMLEQVAGRAGRKGGQTGLVAVQAADTSHPVYGFLAAHDYTGFYEHELEERRQFNYPPFTRIIYVYLRHADRERVEVLAASYYKALRQLFGTRVSLPDAPPVARVQNYHIRRLMLKIEVGASMTKVKQILRSLYIDYTNAGALKGALVHYDVDPM